MDHREMPERLDCWAQGESLDWRGKQATQDQTDSRGRKVTGDQRAAKGRGLKLDLRARKDHLEILDSLASEALKGSLGKSVNEANQAPRGPKDTKAI